MPMTLEEARRTIGKSGSSQEDVRAANDVLNSQASEYGMSAAKLMAPGSTPAQAPASRDYPTGNPQFSPSYGSGGTQFASPSTAEELAAYLGGTVHNTSPSTGPYQWDPQAHIDINGQLFNAGLLADRFNRLDPGLAMKTTASEIAARTGQAWTPPTATPLWSEAVNRYQSAGSDESQLTGDINQVAQRYRRPPSTSTNSVDWINRTSQPGPGEPGYGGGGGGGGGGYGGGGFTPPNFNVSPDDRFDFPGSVYNPGPDPDRNLPPGFDPYASPASVQSNLRRPGYKR